MASITIPSSGVAYNTYVGLVDQANTKLLKAAATIAAGDAKVSKDGGALANLATLPSVSPAGGRAVKVPLSAAEMTASNIVVILSDAAGDEWCDQLLNLQTVRPVINQAFTFYVGLVSQANDKILQANPTLAAGDVKVSINDGAFANLATLPDVNPAGSKAVRVQLSAAEMNGSRIKVVFSDQAGDEWFDHIFVIETQAAASGGGGGGAGGTGSSVNRIRLTTFGTRSFGIR